MGSYGDFSKLIFSKTAQYKFLYFDMVLPLDSIDDL